MNFLSHPIHFAILASIVSSFILGAANPLLDLAFYSGEITYLTASSLYFFLNSISGISCLSFCYFLFFSFISAYLQIFSCFSILSSENFLWQILHSFILFINSCYFFLGAANPWLERTFSDGDRTFLTDFFAYSSNFDTYSSLFSSYFSYDYFSKN